jgi:hypothetical protein
MEAIIVLTMLNVLLIGVVIYTKVTEKKHRMAH